MPSTLTRRRVLALLPSLGSVALTGCLGDTSEMASTTSSPTAASTDEASSTPETSTARPCSVEFDRPTSEFGPSYPPLSSVDSPALAVDFALAFEAALQRNRAKILEPEATYDRVASREATEVQPVESGYLVGVRVEVAYGREVHTSSDPDVESFEKRRSTTAAYFVGDRAVRVDTERLSVVDPRTSPDGNVVACAE